MSRLLCVALAGLGLSISGCAVASNRSFSVNEEHLLLDSHHIVSLRAQNSGVWNEYWREPLLIPFLAYVDYQGPPFRVTLDIEDDENRLKRVDVKRVTLVRKNGQEEDVPIPQAFCSFPDEGKGRRATIPVVEKLTHHEPLELHVDVVLWRADGTQVEFRISGRLVPETRQGMTDAVTFTIYGIT